MVRKCADCGFENEASNRFCVNCGRALDTQGPSPAVVEEALPNTRKICSGCRTINEPTSAYCYRCGLKLPDQLHSRVEAAGNPAGFWVRLAAYLIDVVLLTIAGVLIAAALPGIDLEQAISEPVGSLVGWTTTMISLVLDVGYFTFAVGQWGQTIGKALLGLKVTRTDGSRLTFGTSFGRYWAYLVSAIPLGLGFVAIALSSQKRGWHDLICDTRVVNLRS